MKTIRDRPDAGRVDDVIADLKPYRRFEAVATCIRCNETNRDRLGYDLYRKRGLSAGSGVVKAPASRSSAADSMELGTAGRRREPTHCPQSIAASRTTAGPTSSIGGLATPQLPDQIT